jgi:hypothetical protein
MSNAYLLDPNTQTILPQFLPDYPQPGPGPSPFPPSENPNLYFEFPDQTGNTFPTPAQFQKYQQVSIQANLQQQFEDLHCPLVGAIGQPIKFSNGGPICVGQIDEGITTTVFNLLAVQVGDSLTFVAVHDGFIFAVGQTIEITYSATDIVTGTVTAVAGSQITFTVVTVAVAAYVPAQIYASTPAAPAAGQTTIYGSATDPITPISYPPFKPLSNFIVTSANVYICQSNAGPGTFVVNLLDTNTHASLGVSSNTPALTIPPSNILPDLRQTTFPSCLIKQNELLSIQYDATVAINHAISIIAGDVFIGTLTGYAVTYSRGLVKITAGGPPVSNDMTLWNDTGNGSIMLYDPVLQQWVVNYIILAEGSSNNSFATSMSVVDTGTLPAPFNHRGAFIIGNFSQATFNGRASAQKQATVLNLHGCFYFDAELAEAGAQPIIALPNWAAAAAAIPLSTLFEIITLPQANIAGNEWGDTNFMFAFGGLGLIGFYNLSAGTGSIISLLGAGLTPTGVIETMSIDYSSGDMFIGGSYTAFTNPATVGEYCCVYKLGVIAAPNVVPPNATITQCGLGGSFAGATNFIRSSNSDNNGNFYFSGEFQSPSGPGGLINAFDNTAKTPAQSTGQFLPTAIFTPTSSGVLQSVQIQTSVNAAPGVGQSFITQIVSSDNTVNINPSVTYNTSGTAVLASAGPLLIDTTNYDQDIETNTYYLAQGNSLVPYTMPAGSLMSKFTLYYNGTNTSIAFQDVIGNTLYTYVDTTTRAVSAQTVVNLATPVDISGCMKFAVNGMEGALSVYPGNGNANIGIAIYGPSYMFPATNSMFKTSDSIFVQSAALQLYGAPSGTQYAWNMKLVDATGAIVSEGNQQTFLGGKNSYTYSMQINMLFTTSQWNSFSFVLIPITGGYLTPTPYVSTTVKPGRSIVIMQVAAYLITTPATTIITIPTGTFTPVVQSLVPLSITLKSQLQYSFSLVPLGYAVVNVAGYITYTMGGALQTVQNGAQLQFYGLVSYNGAASFIINSSYVNNADYSALTQIPLFGTAASTQLCQSVWGYSPTSIWKTGFSAASTIVVGRWEGGTKQPQVLVPNALPFFIVDDTFSAGEIVYLASYGQAQSGLNATVAMRYSYKVSPILYMEGNIEYAGSAIPARKITFNTPFSTATILPNDRGNWVVISSTGSPGFS